MLSTNEIIIIVAVCIVVGGGLIGLLVWLFAFRNKLDTNPSSTQSPLTNYEWIIVNETAENTGKFKLIDLKTNLEAVQGFRELGPGKEIKFTMTLPSSSISQVPTVVLKTMSGPTIGSDSYAPGKYRITGTPSLYYVIPVLPASLPPSLPPMI
jgi:hypothetical protein